MASLLILSFVAAVSATTAQAGDEPVTIVKFVNEDGAKQWMEGCKVLASGTSERVNVDPRTIKDARRNGGCIHFKLDKDYWVKDAAVTLAEGKTANTDICQVARANIGTTVEAATMGAAQTAAQAKAKCK